MPVAPDTAGMLRSDQELGGASAAQYLPAKRAAGRPGNPSGLSRRFPRYPRSVTCAAHIRAVLPLMSAAGTPVVRRSPHPRRSATWCGISAVSPMPSATRLPASAVHYLAVHVIAILLSKDPCYAQCRGE